MPISGTFRETILARAQKDKNFRQAMLTEAVNELLAGDLDAGKSMLRDYIDATISFDLRKFKKPGKSLQRMLGPKGNPTAESLFASIKVVQDAERVRLQVKPAKKVA